MPRADLFALQPLPDVLLVDLLDVAAVFLVNAKLAVLHFQARLQPQEIGAQGCHAGAASALPHELQGVQHEAGGYLLPQALQMLGDLLCAHALVPALGALNGQQAHAGGEHAAVHHIDALQLRRGQAGGVEGVGQLRADVQVDDLIALLHQRHEEVQKFLHTGGGGLGQHAVPVIALVHVQRGKAASIVHKMVLPQGDHQGDDANIVTLLQLRGKIHGAVSRDENRFFHSVHSLRQAIPQR